MLASASRTSTSGEAAGVPENSQLSVGKASNDGDLAELFRGRLRSLFGPVVFLLSAGRKRNTSRSSQLPGDSLTAIFFDHGADHGGIAGIVFQANRHFPL